MQFDTVVNYKVLGNSSYVDVDYFDQLHFNQHLDEPFDERFDVNLAKRRKSQAEDRRCQDKFGPLPEKF